MGSFHTAIQAILGAVEEGRVGRIDVFQRDAVVFADVRAGLEGLQAMSTMVNSASLETPLTPFSPIGPFWKLTLPSWTPVLLS
jgi:hypothetical protein